VIDDGAVRGYANRRQLELLVWAGCSPLEAIAIGRLAPRRECD
jgi:hypothetical protein